MSRKFFELHLLFDTANNYYFKLPLNNTQYAIKCDMITSHADPFKHLTLQRKLFKSEAVIETRPILKMAGNHGPSRLKNSAASYGECARCFGSNIRVRRRGGENEFTEYKSY